MTELRVNASRFALSWMWLGFAAAIVAVLLVAYALDPDSGGFGTHTQLGLPPCGFRVLTGFPCPGCGLTTSFAHGVRGDLFAAAEASLLGVSIFLSSLALFPVSIFAWIRGWSLGDAVENVGLDRWAMVLAVLGIVGWVGRIVATN